MKMKIGGIEFEYDIDGPEDAPAIMLHHSLGTSLEMWDEINIALAQHYRILRYDARGHGHSEAPAGPYQFPKLAGDAIGLMDGLGIGDAYHVGLSMGGMVSQYIGMGAADRARGLILVSTACEMGPEAKKIWDERMAEVRANGMAPQVEGTIKRWHIFSNCNFKFI